jgi:hypothetical protein
MLLTHAQIYVAIAALLQKLSEERDGHEDSLLIILPRSLEPKGSQAPLKHYAPAATETN